MAAQANEKWSSNEALSWLLHKGRRMESPARMLDELIRRVNAAGLQLDRVGVYLYFLHPLYLGIRLVWEPDEVRLEPAPWSMLDNVEMYQSSPMARIRDGEKLIRRKLESPDCPEDLPIVNDLRAEGMTDYFMVELVFGDGSRHCLSISTKRPGGFSDHDLAELESLLHTFALIMETYTSRMLAQSLVDTYLGRISGRLVLEGSIKRGDSDLIDAVIWFSDLRNSTRLAETLGHEKFLALLNDYFDATVTPVINEGGEVLRFIGDASLAVFPIEASGMSATQACAAAMRVADGAMASAAVRNLEREARGDEAFDYGIGLHRGTVLYGNIGIPDRLEFSVIGAAANEAARIEALCKTTGQKLVVSGSVREMTEADLISLGEFDLAGVGGKLEVFGLR